MKISEHLDLSELIRSESAKRNGISNMPTDEHIANFKELAEKVSEIEVLVAGRYVTRDEYNTTLSQVFVKLDTIRDIVSHKADR